MEEVYTPIEGVLIFLFWKDTREQPQTYQQIYTEEISPYLGLEWDTVYYGIEGDITTDQDPPNKDIDYCSRESSSDQHLAVWSCGAK